jgi:hypothetical protein
MKTTKDTITISKKAMSGIAPAIAITAILLVKGNPAVILFWIGIVIGFIIHKNW